MRINSKSQLVCVGGAAALLAAGRLLAATPLLNPGFETAPSGTSATPPGWVTYSANPGISNTVNQTNPTLAHSGSNYFKVFQAFTGSVNYSGIYQDYISGPGATYSAGAWACASSGDTLAGANVAWVEVTFRDAAANMLALYRSAAISTNDILTGTFPKDRWIYLPVTNQFNPATYVRTNTTTRLVAPPGTCFVRCQIVFQGDAAGSAGSMWFDDFSLTQTDGAPYGDWNIVWSDEFAGTNINPKVWTFDVGTGSGGWGNNELEYYTSRPTNAFVGGGLLHVVARRENYGGSSYTSARLKSQGLFSFKYGRVEWRAKLPAGLGFWPALWLLGTNITTIGWPGCGEMDVMENNGSTPGIVQGSLHSGSSETGFYYFPPGDGVTNFHTYTLDWATNAFLFYVDGHLFESQTSWSSSFGGYPFPFNQPFFFIMNLAIGGNYVGNPSSAAINASSTFPAEMQVDYVRVYNLSAPLRLSCAPTQNGLVLTWPTNIVCHLETQAPPLISGLGANWFDLAQSRSPFTAPTTSAAAFFRLASP